MLRYRPYVKRYVLNIATESRHAFYLISSPAGRNSVPLFQRKYSNEPKPTAQDEWSTTRKDRKSQQVLESNQPLESSRSASISRVYTPGRNGFVKDDRAVDEPGRRLYNLKYRDPLKLADDTLSKLKKDKFEEAQELVRKSSSTIDCTVGWNHLIDWQCKKGKINSAVKSYNEMKKRGQTPDAYTYTLIFRGLAQQAHHHPSAVAHSLSIYHSMDAENAPVTPNIIHTNAVLKVCAKAGDMDALFGIAAKLRNKGMRAPNNLTFTTIFNAIRDNALKKVTNGILAEELKPLRNKSVMDARRMWDDIASRWRHGDLWIDEELVCSMGRILLLGGDRDRDDVFALLRQAMNIPQLVIPHERRSRVIGKPQVAEPLEEWEGAEPEALVNDQVEAMPDPSLISYGQFKRIVPATRKDTHGRGLSSFPKPGQNTLSLVMEALMKGKLETQAILYWKIFTEHYGVVPDSANFHDYLRILRQSRLSDETVATLQKMPKHMLETKTFRIAIAACSRDKQNPSAFRNASKVVGLMQETMGTIDLPTLHIYLDTAIDSDTDPKRFLESKKRQLPPETVQNIKQALMEADLAALIPSLDVKTDVLHSQESRMPADLSLAKLQKGARIRAALDRIESSIVNIKATLTYGVPNEKRFRSEVSRGDDLTIKASYQQDALKLSQRMISAYNKLMDAGMVPRSDYGNLTRERKRLSAMVTRFKNKYQPDVWNKFKTSNFRTWDKERPELPPAESDVKQTKETIMTEGQPQTET